MPKYGIATLLEDYTVGYDFLQDNIPLHLTHVDSFRTELNADELAALLSKSLEDLSPFGIKATQDTYYGPNKDILVTEVELSSTLWHMHTAIMKMLSNTSAQLKNPHFHNNGYSPHISAYPPRRVHPGDVLVIDNLVIASKLSDTDNAVTRILAKIAL